MLSFLRRSKAPVRTLRVFVASPGDTGTLRAAVLDVANDLNRAELRKKLTRLEVLRWETDTIPGTAANLQEVINTQIDYDILIVIFRKRFGTPTELANSGTEEEFERAYNRLVRSPGSVQILMYFSDEPFRLSEIDPHQWLRLTSFRDTVARRGVLSHTYSSVDDFSSQVRRALSIIASRQPGLSGTTADVRESTASDEVVRISDWRIGTQKLYPQWGTYREIPIMSYKGRNLTLRGTFYSESPHFRFGFKTFKAAGEVFGRETVQTSDPNCLIHLGLNKDRPQLFLSPYINGNRVAANIDVVDYRVPRPVHLEFLMLTDRNQLYIEDSLVYEMYSPEKFRERFALVAWGDHDEYLIQFTDVSLKVSRPSRSE